MNIKVEYWFLQEAYHFAELALLHHRNDHVELFANRVRDYILMNDLLNLGRKENFMPEYKGAVCRGCYALNSGCGICEKCLTDPMNPANLREGRTQAMNEVSRVANDVIDGVKNPINPLVQEDLNSFVTSVPPSREERFGSISSPNVSSSSGVGITAIVQEHLSSLAFNVSPVQAQEEIKKRNEPKPGPLNLQDGLLLIDLLSAAIFDDPFPDFQIPIVKKLTMENIKNNKVQLNDLEAGYLLGLISKDKLIKTLEKIDVSMHVDVTNKILHLINYKASHGN